MMLRIKFDALFNVYGFVNKIKSLIHIQDIVIINYIAFCFISFIMVVYCSISIYDEKKIILKHDSFLIPV